MIILYILLALLAIFFILALIPLFYKARVVIDGETTVTVSAVYFLFTLRYIYEKGASSVVLRLIGIRLSKKEIKAIPDVKEERKEAVKSFFGNAFSNIHIKKEKKEKKGRVKTQPKQKGWYNTLTDQVKRLTSPDLKIIMGLILRFLKKFARVLMPKRVSGTIGMGDPYRTGLLLGFYEAVAGMLGIRDKIRFGGDFDNAALTLDIDVSGRISPARMLWPLIWLICHKQIWNIFFKKN